MRNAADSGETHVVELGTEGLRVDGEFRPLVAGAFEFWRHHPLFWRTILKEMKASGLEYVGSFVCWEFHELARGDFDFVGRTYPSRDLAGFIDLCREERLGVLIRIGPYIDAEWPSRGLPADVATLERLHPHFKERTREYVQALAPILIPRLASTGGPIVAIQIDCESYFPRATSLATDSAAGGVQVPYDEDLVMGLYRKWLQNRYPKRNGISEAWKRPGLTIQDASEPNYKRASLAETLDSFAFMSDAVRQAFEQLRAMCTEAGLVGVPFYTNNKNLMHFIDWREIEKAALDCHSFGMSFPNLWPGDQKLIASWYLRLFRARTKFCLAGEFLGGTAEARADVFGILTPEHNRFSSLLAMALGLRGLCYYMFVDRDNSLFSPISPLGQVRPRMAAFRDAIRVLKELRPDEHVADLGLLWSMEHHQCLVATRFDDWRSLSKIGMEYGEPKELGPWWSVFRRLHELDADFDIAPLDQNLDRFKVLIYAGPDFAKREDMEQLRQWVDRGGRLIVVTSLPTRSAAGDDLGTLADPINCATSVIHRSWGGWENTLEDAEGWAGVRASSPGVWTFAYRDPEGASIFIANVTSDEQSARVKLGDGLLRAIKKSNARDALGDRTWQLKNGALWPEEAPTLRGHEVRYIRVAG